MRAILYGIPFSALLSQVRTTENHLFAQKVLFFCSKKMYNVIGMCSFLLFVGDFRDLSEKFAIAIYPREGTKTPEMLNGVVYTLSLQFIPARGRKLICGNVHGFYSGIAIYPREGTKTTTILTIAKSLLLQFIPARGRKHPRIAEKLRRCVLLQFIPARGRKQIKFISKSFSLTLQFIPARGRKRIVARCHHNQPALQFIPARGRKQK